MMRSPGWCARVFVFGVQRSYCFLDQLRRCVVQPEQQVCLWLQVIWSIFSQSFTAGKTLAPFLASASGVLETDGFCVCDAAQSFLGLGKGTQVLYSTSNKRSTLCGPEHLSCERLQRSFLALEGTRVLAQEKTPPFILEPSCLPDLQYQHHSPAAQCLRGRA